MDHHHHASARTFGQPGDADVIPDLGKIPRQWFCPNCTAYAVTYGSEGNRFHPCQGLAGITAPMLPVGSKAVVVAHEREDYIGKADVQLDGNGRPVMNVETVREDGTDLIVFAPTVHMRIEV